ncbi:hypothetical protein [Streptomyces canus]|uniref:hypothetical protein n=1 Tax=Streptomyces canus TaxID=58343 RepID=UPI003820ADAF
MAGGASVFASTRAYFQVRKVLKKQQKAVVLATFRLAALIVFLGLSIFFTLTDHLVRAGVALMLMAGVRLSSPRGNGWRIETLKIHLSTEIVFHCTALVSLAAAVDAMALGHFKNDLATGQRITITVTLALAALVAVNKSSTRSRKLCTTITERVSSLSQHIEALGELQGIPSAVDKLPDKRRECHDKLDALDRALSTRLNTGYRRWGTPILPSSAVAQLQKNVSQVISHPDSNSIEWKSCMQNLHAVKVACAHQIDVVA